MSWSYDKAGRASKMAKVVEQQFCDIQGCPKGSAEEFAKNRLGEVAGILCSSLSGDPVIRIGANGSAWNEGDKARSQYVVFKFETLGEFVE